MMRLKEWYGYHFPELSKIVTDNIVYTKVCRVIGMRNSDMDIELGDLVPENIETEIKEASEISMGTEINERDQEFIFA